MTINYEMKEFNGRVISNEKKIDGFDFGRCDGLDAIKYLESGKKRFSWLRLPNGYQMTKYYESFEAVIKDDNGKVVYHFFRNHE